MRVAYRGYGFDYGLPAAPEDEETGIQIEGVRHEATGRTNIFLRAGALPYLRVKGSAQWYRHDEVEPSGEVGTTFDLQTQTTNLTGRTRVGRLRGAIGVSGLFKQYAPTGEEALTPSANSNSGGIFLFQELPLGSLGAAESLVPHIQVGARYDVYRIDAEEGGEKFGPARTRDFQNVSGSLGLNVPLSETLSASVSVARAFRAQADASLRGIEGQIEATVGRNVVLGAIGDVIRGESTGGSPLPFMPAARIGGSAGGTTRATPSVPRSGTLSGRIGCPRTSWRPTRTHWWT